MELVEELARELRRAGHATRTIADDTEAALWRKTARSAGKTLGRPIRTFRFGPDVVATLADWPANELEQQVQQIKMRRLVNAAALD